MPHILSDAAQSFLAKNNSKKIVFTNGCFDILHRGHVTYLNSARSLGDILFVGLNSDSSVKKIKGEKRPLNSQEDRKYVLENLKAVSFVEIFQDSDPLDLILQVHPQVLVKGGDWKIENIIGAKEVKGYGGEVKTISFVDGFSTTGIIEKIQDKQ